MSFALDVPCVVKKTTAIGDHAKREVCAVLELKTQGPTKPIYDTGAALPEPEPDAVLLLRSNTTADIADIVEVKGLRLKITKLEPIRDVVGKLDHFQVEAMKCE